MLCSEGVGGVVFGHARELVTGARLLGRFSSDRRKSGQGDARGGLIIIVKGTVRRGHVGSRQYIAQTEKQFDRVFTTAQCVE